MIVFILTPSLLLNLTPLTQVLYYSTEIFAAAGVKHGDIATVVVVGLTLVTFTLITVRKTIFFLNFS